MRKIYVFLAILMIVIPVHSVYAAPAAQSTLPIGQFPVSTLMPPPGTYVVQPGDTLTSIAAEFGLTVAYLVARNNICDPNIIFDGQVLKLRGPIHESAIPSPTNTNQQIFVMREQQKVYVFTKGLLLHTFCVSTGVDTSRTPSGKYHILSKTKRANMIDRGGVDWVMYFKGKLAFRSADWDAPFGWPSTNGSIDMRPDDARWLYHWAGVGMTVIIRDDP